VSTKYLLLEPRVKAIAPNIALMKWSRWCEQNGHEYQYVRGCVEKERIGFIPDEIKMSCIFSFHSKRYRDTIDHYLNLFPAVKFEIGGVFPTLYKKWFESWIYTGRYGFNVPFFAGEKDSVIRLHCGMHPEIEKLTPKYNIDITSEDVEPYPRDKIVMYASRGCVNKCGYCAVPRLEGSMKSFKSIKGMIDSAKAEMPNAKSIVLYDNNFTEHEYFDDIIDELVESDLPVDIHGLHVESFDDHKAKQFARLKWAAQGIAGTPYLRFSFDWMKYAPNVERAYDIYMKHNIRAGFFCYMLFNWTDTPQDFWQRIAKCQEIVSSHENGRPIFLFPQRFEPFKPESKDKTQQGLKRNQYISPKWQKYVENRWPLRFTNEGKSYPNVTGNDLVTGLTRMYTWVHGFLSVTKSQNLFEWIGKDCDEFLHRAMTMAVDREYRLEKLNDAREVSLAECTFDF